MLSFKRFITLLESLTDEEKLSLNSWKRTPEATNATDHFFGQGNDEIKEPLDNTGDKSEIHQHVERHLGTEIKPEEYKQGVVKTPKGLLRLGSAISDPELKSKFKNDNTRKNKKHNNLSVLVTRSKEGIAGQTSHNQSWENHSCKNFNTGSNRHYLHDEYKHGSVVSYLHDHEGNELARATFHPYINSDGVYAYKQDSYYGLHHPEFKKKNRELEKRLSHEHSGDFAYKKHPKVYDNTGDEIIANPNATKDHIDKALEDKDIDVRRVAIQHPNATKEHLDKALNDEDWTVRLHAIQHPNVTKEHLDKALEDKDIDVRRVAIQHPNATKEHLDKALNDEDSFVRRAAIQHPNATKEHLDKALNDEDWNVRYYAIQHPNVTKEHLDKALDDKDMLVRRAAIKHPNITKEHLDKALTDEDIDVRKQAIRHPNVTKEHLDKALDDKDMLVRNVAKKRKNSITNK